MMLVSKLPGMKPAPMPWILWGPGDPPEMTGLSDGSTATICTVTTNHAVFCKLTQKQRVGQDNRMPSSVPSDVLNIVVVSS